MAKNLQIKHIQEFQASLMEILDNTRYFHTNSPLLLTWIAAPDQQVFQGDDVPGNPYN